MINLKDIESKLLNRKDKLVRLPKDTKFTQKNAYCMYINELEESLNNNTDNQDLNEYLRYQTKVSQNSKYNNTDNKVNEQLNNQPNNQNNIQSSIKTSNKLIYSDTDIINIPEFLVSFFKDNNINDNNYYLYGIKNQNSFFTSLILLSKSDYIIKTRSEKMGYISSFKKELAISLDNFYKKYNYKSSKFSKNKMTTQLIDNDSINYPLKVVGVDFIKSNICIVDIENKEYMIINSYEETNKGEYYIVVKLNEYYLPVMNVTSNHSFESKFIEYFKNIYSPFNYDDIEFNERVIGMEEDNSKLKLKSITAYKLGDLQTMANEYNISIKKQDSGKNKTKKDLYQEIKDSI